MSSPRLFLFCLIAFTLLLSCYAKSNHVDQKVNLKQVYIVYMGQLPKGESSVASLHTSMLESVVGSRASEAWLHSYKRSFNGFVARLTEEEKDKIASMDGVVSVFPNGKKQIHTTKSWDFIGFPQNVKRSTVESDVIVGMLDSGIWPESQSFDDSGFSAPPSKWKGTCQSSKNFTCNNKIIGGRYYRADGQISSEDIPSPRDSEGHGSHTASTAAGRLVSEASLFGLGEGTARGGVPSARLAVYKICWSDGCYDADILAGFDDAIADGVDIISISVGGSFPLNYFDDPIAIGAFHAMRNGILTSNSAGNSGPDASSITNFSPWSLSVAASLINRKFLTDVQLGNGNTFQGISVNTFQFNDTMYPLVYGGNVPNTSAGFSGSESRYCVTDSLDKTKVHAKIVLCDQLSDGSEQSGAGAIGTIMQGEAYQDFALAFPLSASYLDVKDGDAIFNYINTTGNPVATIQKSFEGVEESAPFVVSFSSRGPNPITKDILKPDLSAPGVDILAAWSEATTVTGKVGDTRVVPYNIISGTSMSCPHATAAAAYVKSFHPTWSPAAVKSALMTTAKPMSSATNTDAEFSYGSGQIDPIKAARPGLIYDMGESDYVSFLCGQGYNTQNLRLVTGDNSTCSASTNSTVWDLNYPSFTLSGAFSTVFSSVFHRTVTNVGSPVSTYKAIVKTLNPNLLNIQVEPDVLSFRSLGQKMSFKVTVRVKMEQDMMSGSLTWDDGLHQVRTPVVAHSYT